MGARGITYSYKNVEYDSPEETYFAMWLIELKQKKYILRWYRNTKSIELLPAVYNFFGSKKQTVFQNLEYTTDFVIEWDESAKHLFFNELNKNIKITCPFIAHRENGIPVSFVEIKPPFDRNNMTRLFRHIQKFLYNTKDIYINLIEFGKLCDKTYTPKEYLLTKTGKKRVISKWTVRTFNSFLND